MTNLRDLRRSLTSHRPSSARSRPETEPEGWPEGGIGPRVVVEHEDPVWRWAATERLSGAGYQVASCGGPRVLPHQRCPLVAGDECPLIDRADVVVNGLGISTAANRAVLEAVRARRGGLPVVVELPAPRFTELHAELPGCRTVPFPVGPKDLVRAVDDAISEG